MSELDGTWDVKRTGGLLPPLVGIRKRIDGDRGHTAIGPLPGAPFRVHGLELHYTGGFLVDLLTPAADGYDGVATAFGRPFGRFRMTRSDSP